MYLSRVVVKNYSVRDKLIRSVQFTERFFSCAHYLLILFGRRSEILLSQPSIGLILFCVIVDRLIVWQITIFCWLLIIIIIIIGVYLSSISPVAI